MMSVDLTQELPGQVFFGDLLFDDEPTVQIPSEVTLKRRKPTSKKPKDELDSPSKIDFYWESLEGDRPNPKFLQVGDILEVRRFCGYPEPTWHYRRGRFVTSGFWDGRDKNNPQYFFLQEYNGAFFDFDPYCMTWKRVGFDETYKVPRKDNIYDVMVEYIRPVPLEKRIEALHQVEKLYPYTSRAYSSLVHDAWDKALLAVTTPEEYLNFAQKHALRHLPKVVQKYIETDLSELKGEARMRIISSLVWKAEYFVEQFHDRCYTYYKPLIQRAVETAEGKGLVYALSDWGCTTRAGVELKEAPGSLWLEVDGNRMIIEP